MSPNTPIPLLLSALTFILVAMATTAPSSVPQVDFSKMGNVALGGAFSGLDWYTTSTTPSLPFSSTGDTLFVRDGDGYQALGSTQPGGVINALCWASGTGNGTLYVGGMFTAIGSTSALNVASYSLASGSFSPLSIGLAGPVNTLFCDNAYGQIWVGGDFTGNVAIWTTSSSAWSTPFTLNGQVETISPSSNGSSLYFGGHFTTLVSNSTNTTTSGNITSIPSAPANTSTVGNSGYLTPVTIPAGTSIANLTIQAGPSSKQSQYDDSSVLLCPGKGVWLAQDETISNVDIVGYSYLRATGARVRNGLVEGRGATMFW
jgi:hypothetical protein